MTALSVQMAGALLILASYATQLYTQDGYEQSKLNLFNNLVGSTMVAVTSIGPRQWGTALLEAAWAAIAAGFLIRAVLAGRHVDGSARRPRHDIPGRRHRRPQGRHRARRRARCQVARSLAGNRKEAGTTRK